MGNSLSVGTISLELVIKEGIAKQLDKIKQSFSSSLEKPVEEAARVSERAINSVGKSVDGLSDIVAKAMEKPTETISLSMEKLTNEVSAKVEEVKNQAGDISKNISPEISVKYKAYDTQEIQKIVDEFAEGIDKASEKADSVIGKMQQSFEKFSIPTDPVEKLKLQFDNASEKLDLMQEKYSKLSETMSNTDGDEEVGKIISQMNTLESQMIRQTEIVDKFKNKLYELSENKLGDNLGNSFEEAKSKCNKASEEIGNKMRESIGNREISTAPVKGVEQELGNTQEKISMTQKKWQELKTQLSKASSTAGNTIKKILGGAFNGLKATGTKAINSLKSGFGKLKSGVNGITNPINRLGKNIKSAFKSAFLMASLYAAFRAMKEGLSNATSSNEEFSKSLNEVKANLSIAFTPIIQAIMPALNTLMSGLASVTKQIAGFIAGLFGSTYKKAAETTKKLSSVTDKAKKATKSLAGFDEINTLSSNEKESDSDSGIDYSSLDMAEPKIPDWAKKIQESIKSGDWRSVGSILAQKISGVFSGIDWDKIQSKLNSAIKSITDLLNGFVKDFDWDGFGDAVAGGINTVFSGIYTFMTTFNWSALGKGITKSLNKMIKKVDWKQIGKTIASFLSAAIDTLYEFVTGFDWAAFGQAIGSAVNAWFEGIDFGRAGETLSEAVKGMLDTVINFIQTIDWQQIGEKIFEFISSIDWGGIMSRLWELIGSALGAAVSLLWGFIKNAVFAIRDYFKEKIQECGGNIVEGLFKGIGDAIKGCVSWIREHIFQPFINGFKKVFGIHSPSTVMAEMGDYIIQGLKNAISDGIEKIKEIFGKVLDAIKNVFSGIKEWFSGIFSGVWSGIKKCFESVKIFFGDVWEKIQSPFLKIKDWFSEKFSDAWEGVKSVTEKVWNAIVGVIKAPINLIIGLVNGLTGAIESAINWIVDGLNSISIDIPSWLTELTGISKFGFNLNHVDIPEIPKLAKGGIATAPTLAMVGDNSNAKTDPEIISPLSKLQGMLSQNGGNERIYELLLKIYEALRQLDLTAQFNVDGRMLEEIVIKIIDKNSFITNGR